MIIKLLLDVSKHFIASVDCLVYEMIFIKELKPSLNVQSDSLKAKLL